MIGRRITKGVSVLIFILSGLVVSCAGSKQLRAAPPRGTPFSPTPSENIPALQILDYKNRDEGAPLALWFRSYLQGGISGVEALASYSDSYIFVARIYSANRLVINQWFGSFSPDRDFSRLVAERIRVRLERGLSIDPMDVYGRAYESLVKEAYRTSFWGGQRVDDFWVRGLQINRNEGETLEIEGAGEAETPRFWGFVLVSIPKDTLEIQISALLQAARSGSEASREQNAAFEQVKEGFFDRF